MHQRQLRAPLDAAGDPASRLIGVHTGHLWVTAALDALLSPAGAMNAQGLLNLTLGWGCMALLCRAAGASPALSLALGLPFGLGLHGFRDLNWTTIEKSSMFWLPLFGWSLLRAWTHGGRWRALPAVLYGLMSWMNLYWGLVGAALGGLSVLAAGHASWRAPALRGPARAVLVANALCAAPGLLLGAWQGHVMAGGAPLGTPEQFLWQRAALDSVTIWPPTWSRLELWRALNPAALALCVWGGWRGRRDGAVRAAALAGALMAALALGPVLWWTASDPQQGIPNPLYMLAWHGIPGFWRVAKPEVFFLATWMLLLLVGARGLRGWRPAGWRAALPLGLVMVMWLALVRTHPAYPGWTRFQESSLDPAWKDRVFGGAPTAPPGSGR